MIYLQVKNKESYDDKFASFIEYSITNKIQEAETCLKEYVLKNVKDLQIDVMLLRLASSITRCKTKKTAEATDNELLDSLSGKDALKESDLAGVARFHRYVFGVSHSRLLHHQIRR